ncbi:alanine--tRNA ligase [Striga asiatica]|uniref:Alanine--tRNA ligase n=1 Tax=Striga asiatica TaxID=4170 RepID=A0A5A7QTS7_STRAF|nr:alanine--tRNA ligase [Striga asiatica]
MAKKKEKVIGCPLPDDELLLLGKEPDGSGHVTVHGSSLRLLLEGLLLEDTRLKLLDRVLLRMMAGHGPSLVEGRWRWLPLVEGQRSFQPLSEDGAKQSSVVESSKSLDNGPKLLEAWPRRTLVPSLAVVVGLWRSGLLRIGGTIGLLLEIIDGRLSLVMTKDGPPFSMGCHGELPVKAATGGLRGSKDSLAACYRREFPEEITGSRLDVGGWWLAAGSSLAEGIL